MSTASRNPDKFHTKAGLCTAYALACGYADARYRRVGDTLWDTRLIRVGGCLHYEVRVSRYEVSPSGAMLFRKAWHRPFHRLAHARTFLGKASLWAAMGVFYDARPDLT